MAAPGFCLASPVYSLYNTGSLHLPCQGDNQGLHKGWGFICSIGTERDVWDLHHARTWALSGRNVGNTREARTETVAEEIPAKQPRS